MKYLEAGRRRRRSTSPTVECSMRSISHDRNRGIVWFGPPSDELKQVGAAPYSMAIRIRQPSVLPGFGLTMGFTLLYFALIVLIPLSGLVFKTATMTWPRFWAVVTDPRSLASYRLSFGASLISAVVNAVF